MLRWSLPWLALAAYVILIAIMLPNRHWDPDEFEHAQAAWLIAQGLIPFVDFFEHHTPLWHLLAALPARLLGPAVTPDGPMAFLVGARLASLAASLATVALTWTLARRLAGRSAAAIAAALLASASFFLLKGIEVRPDPLAMLGLITTSYALTRATTSASHRWAVAAGIACGLTVMASQKAICAAPGLALGFLWLASGRLGPRAAIRRSMLAAAAAFLAALPVLGWFAAHDALGAFLHHTVTVNLHWTRAQEHMVWQHLATMIRHDALLGLLAVLGAIGLARHRQAALVLAPMVSLSIGAVALPVVQEQYFLMALPYAAITAGWAAVHIHRRLHSPLLRACVTGFVLLLLATTARNLHTAFYRNDAETRAKLAHLLATTPPDATVMAGWSTGIAFRRPAWFYFFLHAEVQAHIPPQAYDALAEALRGGQIQPAVIDLDPAMSELPPAVLQAIHQQYEPSGVATLLRRRAP